MLLLRVISGAQTGADRGALMAAKDAGIATGGWMPKGFLALDGEHPEFASEFGIRQHTSPKYPPRTKKNVHDSDGTIRIASNWASPGEKLTLKCIEELSRMHMDLDITKLPPPEEVARWIMEKRIQVLNIAGNTETQAPGIQQLVRDYFAKVFTILGPI